MFPKKGTRRIVIGDQKFLWRINGRNHYLIIYCTHEDYQNNFIMIITDTFSDDIWLDMKIPADGSFKPISSATIKDIVEKAMLDGWDYKKDKGIEYNYSLITKELIKRH